MFGNPYIQNTYNSQDNIDRINNQIIQLENMKKQMQQTVQQPTNLTQNFQLAPARDSIRYADNIEEVNKITVLSDTPFFSRDMSILWFKNSSGEIKTYELNEVVLKDEKDIKIDFLMAQIDELKKGMMKYEHDENFNEPIENEKSSNVSTISKSAKKSK